MMRKVIAVDNGIYLCNDGTMWSRKNGLVEVNTSEWIQLDNVPQPDSRISVMESSKEFVTLYSYTDNCCTD